MLFPQGEDERKKQSTRLAEEEIVLQCLALAGLSSKKEGLRVLSPATDLERAEILIPVPIRGLGFGFPPELQLIDILRGYLSLLQPIKEMLAEGKGQIGPPDLRHSFPESHPGKLFFQFLLLFSVSGFA